MMFGTRESFTYQLCSACGSLQISDIPDDLSRYYPDGYYAHEIPTVTWRQRIKRPLGMLRDALMLFTGEWAFRVLRALPAVGFRIATNRLRPLREANLTRNTRVADVGGGSGALLRGLGGDWF